MVFDAVLALIESNRDDKSAAGRQIFDRTTQIFIEPRLSISAKSAMFQARVI